MRCTKQSRQLAGFSKRFCLKTPVLAGVSLMRTMRSATESPLSAIHRAQLLRALTSA